MAAIGEHYRPVEATHPAGIYRVVGTSNEVTLLQVANADGRRRHTGELIHVSAATIEEAFEPASDPDAGLRPIGRIRNQLQGLYWSVRRFL